MKQEKLKAMDVALWFIKREYDKPINTFDGNMKLQKLLYFSQLIFLSKYNDTLFDEDILAYENGCVVEDVRKNYKNSYNDLRQQAFEHVDSLTSEQEYVLRTTAEIFGDLSAKELSNLNHAHRSWEEAFKKSDNKGYRDKNMASVSIENIKKYDISNINKLIKAHDNIKNLNNSFEVVNGITFYYNPKEITLTEEIMEKLEHFKGEENTYTLCMDKKLGLMIY